jgi:hypothetical protein
MQLKKYIIILFMYEKIVVIHQPDFMPYLGFFHRLLKADLYLTLDDVQFVSSSRSWTNRDKIKTENGEKWLTLSVNKSARKTKINQIEMSNLIDWRENNINLIIQNYKKSKFFDEVFPYLEGVYASHSNNLSVFNLASITMLTGLFDIKIDVINSSGLRSTKTKSERLVELLKQVNATHYLSGVGAKNYHIDKPFDDANIQIIWQDFTHPVYPQLHGKFIPYLSSIDLLFNCGIKQSREILRNC